MLKLQRFYVQCLVWKLLYFVLQSILYLNSQQQKEKMKILQFEKVFLPVFNNAINLK